MNESRVDDLLDEWECQTGQRLGPAGFLAAHAPDLQEELANQFLLRAEKLARLDGLFEWAASASPVTVAFPPRPPESRPKAAQRQARGSSSAAPTREVG